MLANKLLDSIPKAIRIIRRLSTESLGGSLSLQQMRVLMLISEGQGQTQIADTLQVSLAAISKVIHFLIDNELILSEAGSDRRTHILSLTPKGKQTLKRISSYVQSKLEIGIADLTKAEKDQLLKALSTLDRLMQKVKEV